MLDNPPPHDIHAEEAVLGSILIDGDSFRRIATFLSADDFWAEKNRHVFKAMQKLMERNVAVDSITVSHQLLEDKTYEDVGGIHYLSHLVTITPVSVHVSHYAQIVHYCSRARKGIELARNFSMTLSEQPSMVDETIRKASNDMAEIYEDSPDSAQRSIREILDDVLIEMSEMDNPLAKISTGFAYMDRLLAGGITPEELAIIGGRPGGGKSVIAMQLAMTAIRQGKRVLAFTMEMGGKQIARRLISADIGMDSGCLDDSVRYSRADSAGIIDSIGSISDVGDMLIIDDSAAPSVEYIRNVVLAHVAGGKTPDMVIVDHLQLVSTEKTDRGSTRNAELDGITRSLKALAREHSLVVLATSQLNRAVVSRDGKPPSLSDLRDSGTIEQNADIVMLIHHPKSDQNTADTVKAQFIIAKNRAGAVGDVGVWFEKAYSRFKEK